ncbi:MAG: MarR family transcriptional regulator [Cohaesibacteraceae bacterium]|nr:MarR family transcriptional regulator [Cohaesibacteraceae bacterium]MBL4875043.1 MarR family transcriptional regulator [Cohaesibacteraceae bacterium]
MKSDHKKPDLIDHIGLELWRATRSWKQHLNEVMVENGYMWFGEARGKLIQYIRFSGTPQTELALKTSMTKQAIQQHLDDLVKDGIVERISDPADARKKLVKLSVAGMEAFRTANKAKREIEQRYEARIGKEGMMALRRALELIIEDDGG